MSYTESLTSLRKWAEAQSRVDQPQFNTKRSRGLADKYAPDLGFMKKLDFSASVEPAEGGQGDSMYLGLLNERQAVSEAVTGSHEEATNSRMDSIAVATFDRLQKEAGKLVVTSAFRSKKHNAAVGGAKHSQHTHGKAFDVSTKDMSRKDRIKLIGQAREAGFNGIGIYNNSMHFDIGPKRHWGPSYKSNSTPKWAIPYL